MIPDSLLTQLEKVLSDAPDESVPVLLGDLERLKGILWTRLFSTRSQSGPRPDGAGGQGLLSIPEVADRLSLPQGLVYELARQGRLPIVRIGKYVRVEPGQLEKWIEKRRERGVDKDISFKDNTSRGHGRRRAAKAPQKARADAEGNGRSAGSPLEQLRKDGAR